MPLFRIVVIMKIHFINDCKADATLTNIRYSDVFNLYKLDYYSQIMVNISKCTRIFAHVVSVTGSLSLICIRVKCRYVFT